MKAVFGEGGGCDPDALVKADHPGVAQNLDLVIIPVPRPHRVDQLGLWIIQRIGWRCYQGGEDCEADSHGRPL